MPPVLAAIPAALAAAAAAGLAQAAIMPAIIAGVETLALGTIANLLAGQPHASVSPTKLDFAQDATEARRWAYGEAADAGTLKYWETTGSSNGYVWYVVAVHDTPCQEFTQFYGDHEQINFDGSGNVTTTKWTNGRGDAYMWFYPHLGAIDQAADANLVAESSGAWTASNRLLGIAYYVWKLRYSNVIYAGGRPMPMLKIKGRKVWDPRKDTDYGGSGTQKLDDDTTWTYSRLASLCLLDFLKGIYLNGVKIGGCGCPIDMIDVPSFQAATSVCDNNIDTLVDGMVNRYTIDGFVTSLEDKQTVVAAMLDAMAGVLTIKDGKIALYAGAAAAATVTLTDDDLAGNLQINPSKALQDKHNAVTATYYDFLADQGTRETPPLTNATYKAEDGGLDLEIALVHRFTGNSPTAQRLNKIYLMTERDQLTTDAIWKPVARKLQLWDTYYWTSEAAGYTAQKMRVIGRHLNLDGSVRLISRQETDAKWDWDKATDEQVQDTAQDVQSSFWDRITSGSGGSPSIVTASSSPLLISEADFYNDINNTTGAALEVRLPATPVLDEPYVMTDYGGNAGTYLITIKDSTGTTTIDTIAVTRGTSKVRWNGTAWVCPT